MDDSGTIVWKGKKVGRVTGIRMDMWYMDAKWQSNNSAEAAEFEKIASRLDGKEIIKTPTKGIVVVLQYDNSTSGTTNCLVLSLKDSEMFMRLVSDEIAVYADQKLLSPWQATDKQYFYVSELKKELSFFHPLKWKKVRAIGIRGDRDDVLFELLNSRYKFAVVHLTWKEESSRKFPVTQFYKDWEDFYKNRLMKDHEEWRDD